MICCIRLRLCRMLEVNFAFWAFSEVGLPLYGVLGSSSSTSNAQVTAKIANLSDTPAPIDEYGTHVTDKGTP
jgi:hypothetical protein